MNCVEHQERDMNRMTRLAIAMVTAGTLAIGTVSAANAGGLLGDMLNGFIPGLGTTLDQWNADNRNVVDHAVAGLAESVFPGAGEVIEGYYAYNRGGIPGLFEHELGEGEDDSMPLLGDDDDDE
jgi:hypothetical protein